MSNNEPLLVGEIQEEILCLCFLVGQLLLKTNWYGNDGRTAQTKTICAIIYSILRVWSSMLVPATTAIKSKLEILNLAYPDNAKNNPPYYPQEQCNNLLLFKDMNGFLSPQKKQEDWNGSRARQVYFGSKKMFDEQFRSFQQSLKKTTTSKGWANTLTEPILLMLMTAAVGKANGILYPWNEHSCIMNTATTLREKLSHALADLILFTIHFCDLNDLTPILSGPDHISDTHGQHKYRKPFRYTQELSSPHIHQETVAEIKL